MGEGYRIIAASKGLQHGERQTITRFSPSHDALCGSADGEREPTNRIRALAFYPLPSGRLCVAYSCYAGDEHTGRGGKRIYTHNLIFEAQDFPHCAYNGFAVLRAVLQTQGTSPQLSPPPVLPELQLPITESTLRVPRVTLDPILGSGWRRHILLALLSGRSVIVNASQDWFEAAEAILLAIPGPMRKSISFGAGLKFSLGRCHRLSLLYDDHRVAKTRVVGQHVEYLDPSGTREPPAPSQKGESIDRRGSAWVSFVERHWSCGDMPGLARRTSRAFDDFGGAGRERVGRLYDQIDAIPRTEAAELLRISAERLSQQAGGVEAEIIAELLDQSQRSLLHQLRRVSWEDARKHWPAVCTIWWQSEKGRRFAAPLIEQGLRIAGEKHPIAAAEAALQFVGLRPSSSKRDSADEPAAADCKRDSLVATVLEHLARWVEHASDAEFAQLGPRLNTLICKWQVLRPTCPLLNRIQGPKSVPLTSD
jgi:hypothetical protein